jgi:methyl-accepting chemotaxis protein
MIPPFLQWVRFGVTADASGTGVQPDGVHSANESANAVAMVDMVDMVDLARHAGALGLELAELSGMVEDLAATSALPSSSCRTLAGDIDGILHANRAIAEAAESSRHAVGEARDAVTAVGEGVVGAMHSLKEVSQAAAEMTQIALQTRLVAFNASVEAKRAGEAGREFAVVADAIKDLAAKVEQSSKLIMSTVMQLDRRIDDLSRDIRADQGTDSAFHAALARVEASSQRIATAAHENVYTCASVLGAVNDLSGQVDSTAMALAGVRTRAVAMLGASESMIELTASSGARTVDTPYIERGIDMARDVSALLEQAIAQGRVTLADLFDERYQPVAGSDPVQYTTRFTALTDQLLPELQEAVLASLPKVVFCAAVDRNGYLPTHNLAFSRPQGTDPVWNAAHCCNRRIFDDRAGLAAARSTRPFLLQTYRRDMGGGQFAIMKDLSAPIVVQGRHWGGLRIAYRT